MTTKKLYNVEWALADGFLHIHEGISFLLVWGFLCILILAFLSFAGMQFGGQSEYDDGSLVEGNFVLSIIASIRVQDCPSAFPTSVFKLFLFFECLRSHIGEKRPADHTFELSNSALRAHRSVTALLNSAVIFFTCSMLECMNGLARVFSLAANHRPSAKKNC